MEVSSSKSNTILDSKVRRGSKLLVPCLKRTCLSAESALTRKHNVGDTPLGAKLPMIPGSKIQLYTTNLCEKLYLPSSDFERIYPRGIYISSEYLCLHDPHLKKFFVDRPEMLKRLRRRNMITPQQKIVCSLKEYNLYRQYLKHLSIGELNKKSAAQRETELDMSNREKKRNILEKQQDLNNPITVRLERAKQVRNVLEREKQEKRERFMQMTREDAEKREKIKREDREKKLINEEVREREREKRQRERIEKEMEKIREHLEMRDELLNRKQQQGIERRKTVDERLKKERKFKEKTLLENFEKKKEFQKIRILKMRKIQAAEEVRRKMRVSAWESYFGRQHKALLATLDALKERDRLAREKQNKRFEQRLKSRGRTGSGNRVLDTEGAENMKGFYHGYGDGGKILAAQVIRQLSAMGFHDVKIPPELIKAICDAEDMGHSSGDAAPVTRSLSQQAQLLCEQVVKQGYASEYVRHVIEIGQELEATSRDLVSHVIDVSKNVLVPMLEAYEERTGVKISVPEIPTVLHEVCSGVFDEEEDYLPQIFSFHTCGKTTIHAGPKKSNVRFIMSQTDLPMDVRHLRNRPPTPKKVRFSPQSGERATSDSDIGSDSHAVLEETIKHLSDKVVRQIFRYCDLAEPELDEDQLQRRVNEVAQSIIDEIVVFGAGSVTSVMSTSDDTVASLEEKISRLARRMITDVVYDSRGKDTSTQRSSSASSASSTTSSLGILALRVVQAILSTVDPVTGRTIRDHTSLCPELEEKVANLSAKVVDEVIKERQRQSAEEDVDHQDYIALEEKLSRLALNIVTSTLDGKSPGSPVSSLCSAEVEERVLDLSSRIIGGIISLKSILPKELRNRETPCTKPSSSVERVLQQIFNIQALQDAPDTMLQKVTKRDVRRMSDDITRRLVPPRESASAISSGLNQLAAAMTQNAVVIAKDGIDNGTIGSSLDSAVQKLADVFVEETLAEEKLLSVESDIESAASKVADTLVQQALARDTDSGDVSISEDSKLSSALNEIARILTQNALERSPSSSSAISSEMSELAGAITGEVMGSAVTGGAVESTTESALQSGISILADSAVSEAVLQSSVMNSSTRSAISSGIKTLAEKIAQQAIDMSTADPEGIGSSTRSAISSGASHLASQVTSMLMEQAAASVSITTLESILSAVVSDMVADMLTQRVLQYAAEHSADVESEELCSEVEKRVLDILGMKAGASDSNKVLTASKSSNLGETTSSAVESGISDLASDVVKELLTDKSSREPVEDFSSSAVSAVAARFVYQVLGLNMADSSTSDNRRQGVEEGTEQADATSSTNVPLRESHTKTDNARAPEQFPHPPKAGKPTKPARKTSQKEVPSGNLEASRNTKHGRSMTFASSFSDWRNDRIGNVYGKPRTKSLTSLAEEENRQIPDQNQEDLDKTSTDSDEVFEDIMENLATRIVSSVMTHRENEENRIPAGQAVGGSRSMEQLVGTLALGVVTSLLGLDVLNGSSSSDLVTTPTQAEETGAPNMEEGITNEDENVPGPSAGLDTAEKASDEVLLLPNKTKETDKRTDQDCSNILSILCSEEGAGEGKKPANDTPCVDNAAEHPHRVMSPTRRTKKIAPKKKSKGKGSTGVVPSRVSGLILASKCSRKVSASKSPMTPFEANPLKPSAGFLDRHWARSSKVSRQSEEKFANKMKQDSRRQPRSPSMNGRRPFAFAGL